MVETKFKDTEVGRIPEDWEVKTIGEIASICGGGTPSTKIESYWGGNINWFTPAEIAKEAGFVYKSSRTITESGLYNSSAKIIPQGSILLTTRATIGNRAIAGHEVCTNQGFQSLIPKRINNIFLYYHISTIIQEMLSNASGSTFLEISGNKLSQIKISVPFEKEQLRIASTLTSIDNLISSLDKLIAKKKNIKQGTMQQLLTGKKRLKGYSEPWVTKSLSEIGYLGAGGTPSTFMPSYWNGGINWLQSGAVQNCIIYPDSVKQTISKDGLEHSAAYIMPQGSVLIAITGATCANIGYLTFESSANQSVVGLTCNPNNNGVFIYQKLLTERENILSFKGGSAQSGVSLSNLRKLTITIPNSKKEQIEIASVLTSMDNEISALESKKAKYESIKQGMMQQLLTGKIRLI